MNIYSNNLDFNYIIKLNDLSNTDDKVYDFNFIERKLIDNKYLYILKDNGFYEMFNTNINKKDKKEVFLFQNNQIKMIKYKDVRFNFKKV